MVSEVENIDKIACLNMRFQPASVLYSESESNESSGNHLSDLD